MFKLESYITPILLSYVDKYIKNFRPEDSQVSLWGGDASFHNLDLRLEVLEQELQLPFSFVSGHIHELLIHVPWTKLASEPITITINTIECILKLRNSEERVHMEGISQRRSTSKRQDVQAPPSYVQSLINKIVNNIKIFCNNLILKYVEEDIVVSMNIKLLTFESANERWEPAYIDISSGHVVLRKLISISDLTICLDKRNAAGKIDVYQEPVLYRCSLVMHMLRQYHTARAKQTSTLRLDIYCSSMEFGMTEQQVPMLMRIGMLLFALQQKQFRPETESVAEVPTMSSDIAERLELSESWTGWAWSFVPSIFPTSWDEEWSQQQQIVTTGHTVHIGFYVDFASVTFKVSESNTERGGYYSQRKVKYIPLLALRLQGIYMESVAHGTKWFHCSFGISQAIVVPIGPCSCSYPETTEGSQPTEYIKAGLISMAHKSESLFDAEAPENKGQSKIYNMSWEYHLCTMTEQVLLERTPAFALDYLYQLEVPDDMSSERLSELGSDLEYSNLLEKSLLRAMVGPCKFRMCSGFFHRISSLKVASSAYDYSPYSEPKPDPLLSELPPPCAEDFDALSENIPKRTTQITILAPVIEFQLLDHPFFKPTKRCLYRKRKKLSTNSSSPNLSSKRTPELPRITLECQCIDAKFEYPMYIKRLVLTVCQLPDPPSRMFDACHSTKTVKILGICSRLMVSSKRQTTIVTPSSLSFDGRYILKPHYWANPDIPHEESTFQAECITFTGTKAKLMVVGYILNTLLKMDNQESFEAFSDNSLLRDASRSFGMPYLELCIEGIRFKKVTTNSTSTIDSSLGSLKAFIYEPILESGILLRETASIMSGLSISSTASKLSTYSTRDIQQVLFISGPEPKDEKPESENIKDLPLFTTTFQFPLNPENQPHPPVLVFSLQEMRICIDPSLCRWLLYQPKFTPRRAEHFDPHQRKTRHLHEASGSIAEIPRRAGTPHESIHSSSEREHLFIPPPTPRFPKESETEFQEKIYNFLKKWFSVWKSMLLNGEISQCTIYFPIGGSLSAIGSQGIQEAVNEVLKKENPPEILVVSLPSTVICSAAQRQGIYKYLLRLPIKLPHTIWTSHKSGFPWIISITEMNIYTVQNTKKLHVLKSFNLNATVGVSTKASTSTFKSAKPSKLDVQTKPEKESSARPDGNLEHIFYESLKSDFGPLGICIHIDMSSISIALSEVQVCLIGSILCGLSKVISNLLPEHRKEAPKSPDTIQQTVGWSSTVSPTLLKESTMDSMSEQTPPFATMAANIENENVKLTAWVQWTIARFQIKIFSRELKSPLTTTDDESYLYQPDLKLVLEAEDIVSSVDFQSVYLKIKSKIASASIQHFKRKSSKSVWEPGQFLGLVLKTRDDVASAERHADIGFATITITRANCQHTHALWGAAQKHRLKESKLSGESGTQFHVSARYITEIVITTQSLDIVLSPSILRNFYMVVEPLLRLSSFEEGAQEPTTDHWLLTLNTQLLPLIYVECQGIRVIIPSVELGDTGAEHDVCMFQVDTINLTPSAVNPICRTPCRPDIYQLAAQSRILHIPGSEVEDRQYQLDIVGMSLNTGTWKELDPHLSQHTSSLSTLRTMSENPALEWNNLEKGRLNITPNFSFWPLISKFDLTVIVAPAITYHTSTLVCGHSMEVNCVTDMDINLSLSQIKLASALCTEFLHIIKPFMFDEGIMKRPKIMFPYPTFDVSALDFDEEDLESLDFANRDSGIETSELFSIFSTKTRDSGTEAPSDSFKPMTKSTADSEKSLAFFPRPPHPPPTSSHNVPMDLLITGGKISLSLYQLSKVHMQRNSQKDTYSTRMSKESDYEGYEASEEGSIDETQIRSNRKNRFQPLLFIAISQPNAFLSRFYLGRKIQVSCFDVCIKISGPEYVPLKTIPTGNDYPIDLLETKLGMPNPETGCLPAFFTFKWGKGLGKPATVDVDIGRPTRILCSVTRWNYVIIIKDKIMDSFWTSFHFMSKDLQLSSMPATISNLERFSVQKVSETYTKFKKIKQKLYDVSSLNIKLSQIILAFKTENVPEVNLSISRLKNCLTVTNRPERITNIITLESLTLGMVKEGTTRLLLNPWTILIDTTLFWESWQSPESNPQIQISVESDPIMLDVSAEQINCIQVIVKDLSDFFSNLQYEDAVSEPPCSIDESFKMPADKDQHYKDDLRAGAFQFINATTQNTDELPFPYQVIFWNKPISAMAWRYPQPRSLTKVRIFPVPFKMTDGSHDNDFQILCHLEYWSDCHGCYRPYVQFYLSESEVCHLELPENNIHTVACVWRVVLSTHSTKSRGHAVDFTRVSISPRALAACMRIDSYFNKSIIPDLTLALEISTINVSLHNNFNKSQAVIMPDPLKQYSCDMLIPENHCFASLSLDCTRAYLATWKFNAVTFDVTTTIHSSVLDYAFLTQQTLIEPFSAKLEVNLAKNMNVNLITKPIYIKFGPSIAHTLAVSHQIWEQSSKACYSEQVNLIIMTHYVVCNDTSINLRFGQASTEEDILLPPRFCNLYCWRSQKSKQMLRVALEENGWIWSHPFEINKEGVQMCTFSTSEQSLVVIVRHLSATQKQITFSGQLIICNMLLEHFEMKIVPATSEDKDREFKKAPSHIVPSKSTPPSMIVNLERKHHLRLRFFGLESAWSGEIPLAENTKSPQPWLVKVPLQERGHFLSIWCRIVTEQFTNGSRVLAMLWPLFMVRSNLPTNVKVSIETPTLNVQLESLVRGKGEIQQLYCPGTIDHSHQLSFQLDGQSSMSNHYVPLNYSLVDQKQFFKRPEKVSIDETLEALANFNVPTWPHFGEDYEGIEWVCEEQPLTHVQVRYQNACPHSCALMIELLPWSLIINTLGCQVSVIENEKELFRISQHGIVTPPKLENTFHIGVVINNSWFLSPPLQLAKSEWSQVFYMPVITGTIPLEGNIRTPVQCNRNLCMVSITSEMVNEMRLLKISSSHVVTNHLPLQIQVFCFAIPERENMTNFPKHAEKYSITLAPCMEKSNIGVSLIQWNLIANGVDVNSTYALYMSLSINPKEGWSCPVRLDKPFTRRSITVQYENQCFPLAVVSQEHKGQTYLSLHSDPHPQVFIENKSGIKLFFAQYSEKEEEFITADCQHINWVCSVEDGSNAYYTMAGYSEKYPDMSQDFTEELVIAANPEDTEIFDHPLSYHWSVPININSYNDQFVRIPLFGDVKVTIANSLHTTFITIDSASQIEISARDIRVRLFLHENKSALEAGTQDSTDIREEFVTVEHMPSSSPRAQSQAVTPYNTEGNSPITSCSDTSLVASHLTQNMDLQPVVYSGGSMYCLRKKKKLSTVPEFSHTGIRRSYSDTTRTLSSEMSAKASSLVLTPTIPMKDQWASLKIVAFVKGISLTLISDLNSINYESTEIANLTCDDVVITVLQSEQMQVALSILELQFDNQMCGREGFDFPVVMIGQQTHPKQELHLLNTPIMQWVTNAQSNPLVKVDLTVETWVDFIYQKNVTGVKDVKINVQPISAFIEDVYLIKLRDYLMLFAPNNLVLLPKVQRKINYNLNSILVGCSEHIIWGSLIWNRPLAVHNFTVEPISLLLSMHSSIKLYIALDQSPLQFGQFERKRLLTSLYRFGHALTMHYLSGAIFGAGWVVGSLELLGSPGGLARAMGSGLRDFVSLPYRGLVQGPWEFLRGITHGSASLMKHVTAGTVQSVTKLASSVARNLDRLSLDAEHLKRTEEQRRLRPQGFAQGFLQGLTGLGISLLGAVGGIAHHPIQSVMMDGASPRRLAAGVGLGLVGVITKPLSGAADLVALTGQGLLHGAGWNPLPEPRIKPSMHHIYSNPNSILKSSWKFLQTVTQSNLLFATDATLITKEGQYEGVALVLTTEAVIIINTDEDVTQQVVSLSELTNVDNTNDPTLLSFKLAPLALPKSSDECMVEMDPACRARVVDYVRNSVGLMKFPPDVSPDASEMSVSPCPTPSCASEISKELTGLTFYVNPQSRNYFLTVFSLAKQQHQNYSFPVF